MRSNSAFRRGDGTWAVVKRAMAEARDCFSCTGNFNHRGRGGRQPTRASALLNCARLPLPLVAEINHLPDVMLDVRGALHDHVETRLRIRAHTRIFRRPIVAGLRADGLEHHSNGVIKAFESFVFRRTTRVVKFARAVADISGLSDLRADVVVEIPGEVQHQMSKAVAKGKWLLPEMRVSDWRGQFVDAGGVGGVAIHERERERRLKIGHESSFREKFSLVTHESLI